MLIDCDGCVVRGHACGDCVVTVLLGGPPTGVVLDEADRAALDLLADVGLVPPLRLVAPAPAASRPDLEGRGTAGPGAGRGGAAARRDGGAGGIERRRRSG